ncbi:MAG: hypothetical protein KH138_12000 [Firmicutes bacterium]|nr:hypothetical protein [Bacillota bacterium]
MEHTVAYIPIAKARGFTPLMIKLEANIETLTLKLAWDSDGTKGKSTYKPPNGKKIAKRLGRRFPGMAISVNLCSCDLNRGEQE